MSHGTQIVLKSLV